MSVNESKTQSDRPIVDIEIKPATPEQVRAFARLLASILVRGAMRDLQAERQTNAKSKAAPKKPRK